MNLTGLPLTIGANADQFSVSVQPVSPVAAAGNATFNVRFHPTTVGEKTAAVSIANDDGDENPYILNLTGMGVVPAGTLTVTAPNGGEIWGTGSSHDVTWTTTGTIANVKIEYSTNSGTSWTTIIASTPNDGVHSWILPAVVSANCLVRVSEAVSGTPSDISNAVFAITNAIPAAERQALIDLFNSTNGASWKNSTNWLGVAGTEKTWFGVTTDAGNTTVLRLELQDNNLVGTVPASLGNLSNLTKLYFSTNGLIGSIPAEFGNLSKLVELHLFRNQLTGSIPASLGNLSQMKDLILFSNQLAGSIPATFGNLGLLDRLWLDSNRLTGSIPPELGNLSKLTSLKLHTNQLTGIIPAELGRLTNLTLINLFSNQLTGSIPPELGNLSNLQYLSLWSNQLTGSIPTELAKLSNLVELYLPYNQFTGGIPKELGNLSKLQALYLCSNQLTGSIPAELGNLSNLQALFLYSNQLTGSIPASLGNLSQLTLLYLHSNQLTGSIPPELGNLSALERLYLDYNQLTGNIPTELGTLSNLQYLRLRSNQLTGSIPSSLGDLSNLVELGLHSNQLTGSIPSSLGNLSQLKDLILFSNQLTGSIPAQIGNLSSLIRLWLDSNQLTGSIPASLGNLSNLTSIDIGYNALHTSDAGLITFLNSMDPDWAATQTIAPIGVSAVTAGPTSVSISWTPIAYTGDGGGYRVFYATVAGGPYNFYAQTADKSASSQLVTGLTPGTPYYFVVQTRTDAHTGNQNVVDSENSDETSATPMIPDAILITTPLGGESWIVGSSHNISWTTTGTVANVKIEYSTDSGTSWTTIIASMANTGTYPWTVPGTVSSTCLVRVGESATGIPADVCDAVFSIIPLTISGTVTSGGTALPNVVMSGLPGNPVTSASGAYSSIVAYGWTGTVTPTLAGYTFIPAARSYTNVTTNQTGQDYSASVANIPALERAALIGLYISTNGDAWSNKTGWKTAPLDSDGFAMPGTENTWYGVTTNPGHTFLLAINLPQNNLTGTLPAGLGNLRNLQTLNLHSNQLTGSIPLELGYMNDLVDLRLHSNQLTGSIPWQLGNLSKLANLWLSSNQLTGSIPAELGNLSWLQYLNLQSNQLTGSIPSSFANLQSLIFVYLHSNKLSGSIPTSLTNLPQLDPTNTNIGYNALYTSDAGLIAFLNSKDPDWAATQTIAPTGISAVPGGSSVIISWTPVNYTVAPGSYRVFYSTVAGGPYNFYAQTADKSASSQLVSGLTAGTPYYFVVQTRTDAHANNQNVVDSENSDEVVSTPGVPPASITVTSPNGGETWPAGSSYNMTWTTTGTIANVKIEYSTNNGTAWTTIIASTPNDGSHPWLVPNTPSAACLVRVSDTSNAAIFDVSNAVFTITSAFRKDDFLGTWAGQGVYYRNSDTGGWTQLASPASKITAGDLDGNGIDDLIGIWPTQGGVWVKYSQSGVWAPLSSTADWIATGDMNGDGRDDLLGAWAGQGVYYRDSMTGQWVQMATPASKITAGDLDGDGTDDLIGIWPTQGGVWVKYSQSGAWAPLSSTADWIATGDMNGDGRDDLSGAWAGQGVYYRDSITGQWVGMASPATMITAGDLDADGKDDLIGIWPSQGGVWVKYSQSGMWANLSSTADWMATGKMRAADSLSLGAGEELALPMGGLAVGPPRGSYEDLSANSPGRGDFAGIIEKNLKPEEPRPSRMITPRIPGPGEPGFKCFFEKKLIPGLEIR